MKEAIQERLERAVTERVFPGCVVGVITKRNEQLVIPVGQLTYETTSPFVREKTVYDIASVTKAIPVASLALRLIDLGKLSVHDPVQKFLPELHVSHVEEITPWHLLTQTLDYRLSLSSLKRHGSDAILEEILNRKFFSAPGETMNYSNATSVLLGMLIERVSGKQLDTFADEVFFTPLGMEDTSFHPENIDKARIAPTEDDPWRKRIIQGEIHDESAFLLREKMIAGSAGVFSTAPDLLRFLQMLLNEGEYEARRYFSKEMMKIIQKNQLAEIGEKTALGWELFQPRYMGDHATENTIGKTGFTGCVVMCDISKGVGIVMLSNYHFPKRKTDVAELNAVRRDIANVVFSR
jgi:CubicO group peptidase (beta-lactamase class C family)